MVDIHEEGRAWTTMILRARARLLAMPSKAAPLVAVETDRRRGSWTFSVPWSRRRSAELGPVERESR